MSTPTRVLAAVALVAVVLWPLAIVGAAATAAGKPAPQEARLRLAALVYVAGAYVCHQRPERSFHLGSAPLPVCARCAGLYGAAPAGLVAGLVARGRRRGAAATARAILLLAATPTVLTLAAEWAGLGVSSAARAFAALPLGAAVAWIAGRAITGEESHLG